LCGAIFSPFEGTNESYSVVRETVDVAELYRINYQENQTRGLQALLGLLNILSFIQTEKNLASRSLELHNVTMEAKTNQDHSALLILVWSDLLSL
jgi:hypothetical protein